MPQKIVQFFNAENLNKDFYNKYRNKKIILNHQNLKNMNYLKSHS